MGETQAPWLTCDCAETPPTMPTCRDRHLRSCPMWFYQAVVLMERMVAVAIERTDADVRVSRHQTAPAPVHMAMVGEAQALQRVRGLLEGDPGAIDPFEWNDSTALMQSRPKFPAVPSPTSERTDHG